MALTRPLIAANWKMNLERRQALKLACAFALLAEEEPRASLLVFPGMLELSELQELCNGLSSPLMLGAQNCCCHESGAFTGEVSAGQLVARGIQHVLLGHSERRQYYRETHEEIQTKLLLALKFGLKVTLCIGETLEERESGKTEEVLGSQLQALQEVPENERKQLHLAYEPVWAIGTGKSAQPEEVQITHQFLRKLLEQAGFKETPILYGGSVKPENAAELAIQKELDGFLVGGASLKHNDFSKIIRETLGVWEKKATGDYS